MIAENEELEAKAIALQAEHRELIRLKKESLKTSVLSVLWAILTVLGGIVIVSDRTWPPFNFPAEYN
ncbi:MAG: hypothetical protein LBO66_07945 [Deltaproteobacteria bacterium]|nr:hypothetical protein [Deltaproteobacteria bacterium]